MKTSLLVFAFAISALAAHAQYTPTPLQRSYAPPPEQDSSEAKKGFDPHRLVIGGNLGASFGNYTFINVSPQVGYMFNQYVTAGVGINYVHQGVKYYAGDQYAYKNTFNYAGLNLFARVFPVRFLFVSAQPELNYSWGKTKFNDDYSSAGDLSLPGKFVPSLLVGAGGVLGGMLLSVQYDLIQNPRSPYGTKPYLNIGFAF